MEGTYDYDSFVKYGDYFENVLLTNKINMIEE